MCWTETRVPEWFKGSLKGIVVINLFLSNLQSGMRSEFFLLLVDEMTGENRKYFIGIKGGFLKEKWTTLYNGIIGEVNVENACSKNFGSLYR